MFFFDDVLASHDMTSKRYVLKTHAAGDPAGFARDYSAETPASCVRESVRVSATNSLM
jgi:hypothetical protein